MYHVYFSTTNILFVLLLLLFYNQQINCQSSTSVVVVDLNQFDIRNSFTVSGQCCDGTTPLGNCSSTLSCNLYTIVCLDYVSSGLQANWNFCPLGSQSLRATINNTGSINFYLIPSAASVLPLQFPLEPLSDNSISIKIFIFYDPSNTANAMTINPNALLSRFNTTFRTDASYSSLSSGIFQRQALLDVSRNSTNLNDLIIGLMSYCQATFYGNQCNVQCIPNDDCTGSYTCNSTGAKICSPGWYEPNCTIRNGAYIQPICASTALACNNGGFCQVFNSTNQPTCCCAAGYTGLNCQYLSTCTVGISCLNGGVCLPLYDAVSRSSYYQCVCANGYEGLYCQIPQECPPNFYGPNCTVQCYAPNSCSAGHFSCNSNGTRTCLPGWGPTSTCLIKNISSYLDPECPVSTGCLNGGSCFNGSCCCPSTYTGSLCQTLINSCVNNPCQNNGLCLQTSTGYQCVCSNYYTGSLCDISLNPCNYSPCQNGGQCQLTGNMSFYCTCPTGYTGQFCSSQINYCNTQPCANNGICISTATGSYCVCSSIYTGPNCTIPSNPCLSQPCIPNNTISCTNNNNLTYTCNCQTGFTGLTCAQSTSYCSFLTSPCQNGGTCINTINGYSCQCNGLYQGSDCSIPTDPCASDPCLASGSVSCQVTPNGTNYGFLCTCQAGHTGTLCETILNPCASGPCAFGTCAATALTWSCVCAPGWTGIQCKDGINECLSNPCLNAGICVDGINEYRCVCLTGYTGVNCQTSINPCASVPCQNNGTCVNNVASYACVCSAGWTGTNCQTDINECVSPLICNPNATCVNTIGSYTCLCPAWLTGFNCYTTIDLCLSFPCQNNGVCIYNYGAVPTCLCQSGFTGVSCEININDCQPAPCYNNGTCIDQINSFLCLCPSGYTGLRCEAIINQCLSLPCLNGGTCRASLNGTVVTYICLCPPLYNGTRCEQIINPCASYPCLHGTCTLSSTTIPSYSCQCISGYTGQNCDIPLDQCSSLPCGPYGTCTSLITNYTCCCAPGYTGPQCAQLINYCLTNPCSTAGVQQCISTGVASFTCLCKSGYTGFYCEVNINECLSQPCLNGGICVDLVNGYQCICPSVYGGTNCAGLQDQCTGIECLNDGRCIRNGTNFVCLCANGYQGDNCELIIDYCQSQPCQNGGICTNTESGPQCTCLNGITGLFCEIIIDQCQSQSCQNNATCKSLINQFVCLCQNGFMGELCENERNECEPVNPCLNSGRCIDQLNNFTCICNPGFTGFYCEIQIDECQSNPCLNGGICRTLINGYKCDCLEGYNGTTCSILINYCLSNPCLNNGLCETILNGYRCICLDDYMGLNCENKSDECLSNPCLNNGTCIDQIWNYTCQCLTGYYGSNCHLLIDYCSSSPCINGFCQTELNGYNCICPSSSYTGINCEIQINKCASNPCMSNATCIDGIDRFMCLCPPWYSGVTCSEQIDPCLSETTCANNATCVVNYNIQPYGYTCQCLPGFTGDMCEINVDDCATEPCVRGQCIDGINEFTCSCYSGSDGVLCDEQVNFCASNPCVNSGACISLIDAYQCQCAGGFQGINCQRDITQPCSSSPCLNNGTCTIDSTADYQCSCPFGYTGPRCELTINACASNPCRFGTCQQIAPGYYYCSCSPGYTGLNCQTDINECSSIPCLNNGTCFNLVNAFNCSCLNGYSGIQCQYGGYQCSSGPCLNNGTCSVVNNGYQCTCQPGLTGNRCEIDINECASSPCQNAGICLQPSLNLYQCLCPTGYSGINCQTLLDPCLSIICLNNGTCIRTSLTTGSCSCSSGYTGIACQNQINNCLSAPCINGTCIPSINSYQCYCFPGYTGQRCDSLLNYCSPNPCFNNGTCINQVNSYMCQCLSGFQGPTCAILIQACQSSPCLNGGTCYNIGPGLLNCSCPISYGGSFCQLRASFCTQLPCQNNGICLETLNGYQCICQQGYNGVNCSNIIQPCLSNPCLNNGTCSGLINGLGYQCSCPIGYAGLNCESNINWCSSNPCQNQGTCISLTASFICLCPQIYTGIVCQTLINNCSSLTCGTGLPVIASPTNCSCLCSSGYTGNLCQTPINLCLTTIGNSSYCIRGTCNYLGPGLANCTCPSGYGGLRCSTRLSNGACASCPCLYGQCRIIDVNNSYVCDCYQGYTGQRCQTSINLCSPSPCLYGQCILDVIYGYRCICLTGATGQNCSTLINTCASTPCQNNGICVQGLNTYQCVCQPGYAGTQCQILINQCTSLICLNNGTCINSATTPSSAQCQCPPLFTGLQCQYPYAPCTSQPCQNLGTCISPSTSSYLCLCPNGFTGTNCQIGLSVCSSRPCLNGGTCIQPTSNYYICQCPWPFYGVNCQLACDPCLSYPCRGPLSQCISSPIYYNYTCVCAPGFTGPLCSIQINPCATYPCLNGGTCIQTGPLTSACACPAGYNGSYCETQLNPCSYYPCSIGTSLITSATTCQCQCPSSYYGLSCQINVCQTNPCLTGTCITNGNYSYICNCPVGFQYLMGVCADINECTTIPGICANGGRCLNSYGSYLCFCNSGFYGTNCQIYNPCQSSPCINGGTCISTGNYPYWQCLCPILYTGSYCEIISLGCSSNPCRTGTCLSLSNGGYQCQCPPLITGINCDTPLLPCLSNPCLNNSTCLTLSLTNYTCICPPLYTGLTCSQQIIICSNNLCQGNSTCIVNPITGIQICQCPPQRYGVYCEILSPCGSNPCVRGTCHNQNSTSYQCACEPGFTGITCNTPFDVCTSNPCLNGGICINLGNGLYTCTCSSAFTGPNCNIPLCVTGSCFNGGTCLIENNILTCQCPCGFTGSRCETPFDICSLITCQNNGTRIVNTTGCQCSCLCPSTFTGNLCQLGITPVNRTYPGQITIPINRPGGISWEIISQCIDQVWNNLNILLVCNSPFTLVNPTSFYPYCYQINQQSSLVSQSNAIQDCSDRSAQLVWFQSIDEIQQQLIPALIARGLARDFWTSGIYNPTLNQWQWLLSNNNTRIAIDPSILTQFGILSPSIGQSLHYSFAQLSNPGLVSSSPSEDYSTLCKISATRLLLNNQTRSIDLTSQQYGFYNQSEVIIYNFNYTIFSTIPSNIIIQQPTAAQYAALCGAIGSPSTGVDPYIIDICGYFPSITDGNVQLIMQAISAYYTVHRISILSSQTYVAIPLSVEYYVTISGNLMTQISFIITSGSSIVLGSNIEPLASINDILNTINYPSYQQCTPYISLNILLPLRFCIPFNQISLWTNLVANAVSAAIGQSNVVVMLKGVQPGVTSTGQEANIAYFLITVNGMTYNQTSVSNLASNPILISTITQANNQLLCPNQTQILPLQHSIQDFYISCPIPQILQRQLNNALQQAGIYTINMTVFGVNEAVDNLGQIYRLPNIYIQYVNGTWVDSPLQLNNNNQLYQILISVQMQRLLIQVYRLSEAYSYFYLNVLTTNDQDYLERLILTLYNQQSSITSNSVRILLQDPYLNISSLTDIQRVYAFLFYNDQELDGRYLSSLTLSPSLFSGAYYIQTPLTYISNLVPINVVKQRDVQQITFTGKVSQTLAQTALVDYWQNPVREGLINANVYIIQIQQYLVYSINQYYTTITYIVITSDGYTVPSACFNPNLIQPLNGLCNAPNNYVAQIPISSTPSYIDLRGNYLQADLNQDNFGGLITSALQRTGISSTVSSTLVEPRFGFDISLVTRVYYMVVPYQIVTQQQIQVQLTSIFSTMQPIKYDLYPSGQLSVARSDAQQYIANVSLPLTTTILQNIQNYLTSYNRQYGTAKIVYAETLNTYQTRFYLVFINGTQILTRCDFLLYYPGITNLNNGTSGIQSLYLQRNVFVAQPAALADGLAQLWTNANIGIQPGILFIQLQDQVQYICSGGQKVFRIDYIVQSYSSTINVNNLIPPSNSAFDQLYGQYVNTSHCIPYQARWLYLIEPRPSNNLILSALENAWRQSNNNLSINISPELYFDSSYLTNNNQTLTRVTYTINLNGSDLSSLIVIQPLLNTILLSDIYTNIPYKRFSIYIDGTRINLTSSTTLSMINQALRISWALANSNLFSANDLSIPSINSVLSDNGQTRIDYLIGLSTGDIGDYSQPSERLYTQIFNQTGLQTLVYTRYIPRYANTILINNNQTLNLPFYYRFGPFYGLDWWIILILVVGILTIWLIICLICYACCRKRAEENSSSVVIQDVYHVPNNEPIYATRAVPYASPRRTRKRSVSVVDLQEQPSTVEFNRPRRTTRSVSPENTFRYILPFNSHREQKRRNVEQTSLGNRQDVPIAIAKSPMYTDDYL